MFSFSGNTSLQPSPSHLPNKVIQIWNNPKFCSLVYTIYIFNAVQTPTSSRRRVSLSNWRQTEGAVRIGESILEILLGLWAYGISNYHGGKEKLRPGWGVNWQPPFNLKFGQCSLNNNTVFGLCAHYIQSNK